MQNVDPKDVILHLAEVTERNLSALSEQLLNRRFRDLRLSGDDMSHCDFVEEHRREAVEQLYNFAHQFFQLSWKDVDAILEQSSIRESLRLYEERQTREFSELHWLVINEVEA